MKKVMKKVKNFLTRKPVYGMILVALVVGLVIFLTTFSADEVSKAKVVLGSYVISLFSFDFGYYLANEKEQE